MDAIDGTVAKVDIEEAFKLRMQHGLSYQKIADKFGVSKQAVQQRLQGFTALLNDPEAQRVYNQNTANLLKSGSRLLFTDILDESKREKASLNNTAYAFNVLYQASRLEEGKSSLNVSVRETAKGLLDKLNQLDDMEDGSG